MAEMKAGMSWPTFTRLLSGLSAQSWWFLWLRGRPKPMLEGTAAAAYFAGLASRRGELPEAARAAIARG